MTGKRFRIWPYLLGLVVLGLGSWANHGLCEDREKKQERGNEGLELKVDIEKIKEEAEKIRREVKKVVDSYKGKKEKRKVEKIGDYNLDDYVNATIQVESSGNPNAYNKKSKARGLMQITPIVLEEWNQNHPKEKYKEKELSKPEVNKKIGSWYIIRITDRYLPSYGLEKSLENVAAAYNWGIGNLRKTGDARENFDRLPKETQDYIGKLKQRLEKSEK